MARKKVALRYIRNESVRHNTLKKRSKNLMKKAGEVATLCNAKACVLVYGEGATAPEVFPSHDEAVAMLNRFKSMPEVTSLKKTMDQESVLSQRVAKLRDQVQKTRSEIQDREAKLLLHQAMISGRLPDNIEEITTMGWKLELMLKSLAERITKMSGQPPVYQTQGPYVTDNMDIRLPTMYQPQEGWVETARTRIYNDNNNGGNDGANIGFFPGHMNM
ncbi:agamous-like MADS-box protein AGL80 [Hordeum vulgare subsp. vulgare]|uniref:MADS-box domain-containing protein n=1 Tax=Hordeum vulgare subsp. vulgare TaxID=112509 RepID=A0A8I6YNQ7_HORVV|nr:agamous-like MADS-box protein AGL80 [Hordeum vulgare subsp. vulgare]